MQYDLSIAIPARNEMFLSRTVEDILKNKRGKTEVIVGLDGQWSDPPIKEHPDVTVLYYPDSIGQRAITNQCIKLSGAKYVMKVDSHCAFDEGFDVKMMADMKPNWTMVPIMKNLWAFDWVCKKCTARKYQGPTPTECWEKKCDGKEFEKDVLWRGKPSPNSTSYRFNTDLKFKYFGQYKKKQEGDLVETLSLQGSCFIVTRNRYWDLNLCDEEFGSWGQQGTEVACKSWLSGGRVICNKKTWYAHMFRTQGGDFGFPYKQSGHQVAHARKYCKDLFLNNKWEKQIHPFSWLLEKFWPVPDWTEEDLKKQKESEKKTWGRPTVKPVKKSAKGIVFYTDNKLKIRIAHRVQKNLKGIGLPIVSVSLKPMTFGKNFHLPLQRGYLTMFKQILRGLEESDADIVFFCEHDVLYHRSHFDFVPPKKDVFYYNTNVWRVRYDDGFAVRTDDCRQQGGLCAYREFLLEHYRKRVKIVEKKLKELGEGKEFNRFIRRMGFEAGTHGRAERVDDYKSGRWESEFPNIDIRHGKTLTRSKWKPEDYRNQRYAKGWKESDIKSIPGWDRVELVGLVAVK